MFTCGWYPLVTMLVLCYLGCVSSQVSFSTTWGNGKRSPMFQSQLDASKKPSFFNSGKQTSFYDSPNQISQLLRGRNDILRCFTRMEQNVIKYMTLILENELKEARKCILGKNDVDYD